MKFYAVRITEDPKNPKPKADYENFVNQMERDEVAIWDKDASNRLKKGDYLGFIIGQPQSAKICIYKISGEQDVSYRETSWSKEVGYTSSSIENVPKHRQVIVFDHQIPMVYDWKEWKTNVGYHPRFYPRATQKIKIPQQLLYKFV